jgi:hypothetical protein
MFKGVTISKCRTQIQGFGVDQGRLNHGHWDTSHCQGARLVYRWVPDAGGGRPEPGYMGNHATVFQAEVFAILTCVHDINLLVTRCTTKFNIQQLYVLPTLYLCVV